MDTSKLKSKNYDDDIVARLRERYENRLSAPELDVGEFIETSEPDLSIADEIIDIFEQRKKHRDRLSRFLIALTSCIFAAFVILVAVKVYCKIRYEVDVISDELLGTFAISFFVEVIAVIRGITKALWNEKDILSSPLVHKIGEANREAPSI